MKRFIMSLLPEKWFMEYYYKGVKDAGARVVDVSYWFSGAPAIYDALKQTGKQLIDYQSINPDKIRENIYNEYAEVKNIKPKTKNIKDI